MTLTEHDILQYFRDRLTGSELAAMLSGSIYLRGTRPRGSKVEDAVLGLTSAVPGEIEAGSVTLCVYVPDIDPYQNGISTEDMARTSVLQRAVADWADSIADSHDSPFLVSVATAAHTESDLEYPRQHFISTQLRFKHLNEY